MEARNLGKKIAAVLQALVLALGLGATAVTLNAGTASAACNTANLNIQNGAECAKANGTRGDLFEEGGIFQTIANTLIFLVGAIAVLFLIIGGLRYVVSNGDPKNVEAAKNTILYAIVGIVVAVLSFAAVQFVINAFTSPA